MFRDTYRVSIKIIQGRGDRVTICEDSPSDYETWMLADSRDPLIYHMNHKLEFNVLDIGVDSDTLIGSYESLLSRMPASIRDMRGPAYVSQMNTRRKVRDIHTLFLPLLLETFLKRQKKSLKKAGYKETGMCGYFEDSHKYLKPLLHSNSRAQMLTGRLKISKRPLCNPLVLECECLAGMRNPKRMPLLKKGVLIHATQRTWQEWVRAVINNPAVIISNDTGNKGDKGACKSSNPSDGVKTTLHVATNNTQDGPAYEVIDPAAEIWGDPNDDAELGHRLDEIDTMINTHDKDLYAKFIDNQDGSLWMP